MKYRGFLLRAVALAGLAGAQVLSGTAVADTGGRPFQGSCSTVVTPLNPEGSSLRIDADCQLSHLGHATGVAMQTVNVIGQNGAVLVTTIANTTTYRAANGDELDQSFSGMALINVVTGDVQYTGTETFHGGTGRFADASGTSQLAGTASIFTNVGFFTTKGTIDY